MKDPVITIKHFVLLFNNVDYKIKTHSQDLAFAILQSHFADANSDDVVIETVNAAFFQTLDCQELKEDDS